jgi:carboxypeptidase C (cathepsin A)
MPDEKPDAAKPEAVKTTPNDNIKTTKHTATIGGKRVGYTVKTGTVVLKSESEKDGASEGEKPQASVFFVAYTRDGISDTAKRPITFCFNGGPGSSSVWLHLGAYGPRRVVMGDAGEPLPPPYSLTDNEHSLLDVTDLVFIDPVSTGYSRAAEGVKPRDFHGFTRDLESVGDFIRLFVSREKRWLSPKYLSGESYGTTRASGLAGYLQDRHGLYLNGIVLVSTVLDFSTILFGPGNDLPHVLYLPAFTATAHYHGRLEKSLQKDLRGALKLSEDFARTEYAAALFAGSSLSATQRSGIAAKVGWLTGVSQDYVERSDLRLEIMRFTKELLRDKSLTVGRLDSRFTGHDRDSAGETFEYDPSLAAITGPYSAALNHYVRAELEFESDLPYEILTRKTRPWSYKEFENRYVNVSETLRKAMTTNPNLRVLVLNGYYDLATPYSASDYVFNHLGIPESLRTNLESKYYEAGHMMYVKLDCLKEMKRDIAAFLKPAI